MNDLVLQTLSRLDEENNELAEANTEMTTKDIIEYLCPQRSASRDLGIISEGRIPEKTIWSSERSDMWETIIGEREDEDLSNLSQSFLTVLRYENPNHVYHESFKNCGERHRELLKDLNEIFDNRTKMSRLKNNLLSAINRMVIRCLEGFYEETYTSFLYRMTDKLTDIGITKEILYQINTNRLGEDFLNRRPYPEERLYDGFEIEGDELVKK